MKSFKVRQAPAVATKVPLQRSTMFDDEEEETDKQDKREYTRSFSSADGHRTTDEGSSKPEEPIIVPIPNSYSVVRRSADEKLGSLEELNSEQDIDYDSVPVEEYGKALLRGLGWSEGAAIGKTNKQVVKVIESEPRPKGLGLGAAPKLTRKKDDKCRSLKDEAEDDLQLKVGAHIRRTDAPHTKEYGTVISMDEDNCRVVCQMLLSKATLSLSQYSVEVVSPAEYLQKGRCINQEKYDKYKEKEVTHRIVDVPFSHKSLERKEKSPKREKPINKECMPGGWMYPMARVRFIDRRYAGGKFYKKKGRIEDVVSTDSCTVVFDDGTLLENVKEPQLETVVPHSLDAAVVVLLGKWRGRVGRMLERNSANCLAIVQLADETLKLSYDDFAEYVGDPVED
uniref:G-patch domain-containing protein n=1 Tax=Trichuris muris TaxID=70415 RepID=A0A5S6QTU8_TRIMR